MRRIVSTAVILAVTAGVISGCNIVFPEREFSVSPNKIVCSRGEGEVEIDKEVFSEAFGIMKKGGKSLPGYYLPPMLSAEEIEGLLSTCREFVGWP